MAIICPEDDQNVKLVSVVPEISRVDLMGWCKVPKLIYNIKFQVPGLRRAVTVSAAQAGVRSEKIGMKTRLRSCDLRRGKLSA